MRRLLAIAALAALAGLPPAVGEAADTCEARFADNPQRVVSYSRVAEGGEYTERVDLCRGPDSGKGFDPKSIPLQIDEYRWDSGGWALMEGSPRNETGPCESFTKELNPGAAAWVEALLCSESVSPDEEYAIFRKVAHDAGKGCWKCFDPNRTVWYGSFARAVYCQTPDYASTNKRVHLDSYVFSQFDRHVSTFVCPNISGLTSSEVSFLCGSKLPAQQSCSN